MENIKRDTIIYSLNIEDLQTVALEEIGRELSQDEIARIIDLVATNIGWYDAVANAIRTKIEVEEPS